MKPVAIVLTLVFSCGCASARLYPVCFYNRQPAQPAAVEYYFPRLTESLKTAIGNQRNVNVTSTPDGRWLVAKTTRKENRAIAKVWPRIGCLGDAIDSSNTRKEMDCVSYISQFVKNSNYFGFGNGKDAGGIDIWNESPDSRSVVRCLAVRSP